MLSENQNGKPACPRFHVLTSFSHNISVDEWVAIQKWGIHFFESCGVDPVLKDKRRIIFGTCNHPSPHFVWNANGKFIDEILMPDDLNPPVIQPPVKPTTKKQPSVNVKDTPAPKKAVQNVKTPASSPEKNVKHFQPQNNIQDQRIGTIFNESDRAKDIIHVALIEAGFDHFNTDDHNEHFYRPFKQNRNGSPSLSLDDKGVTVWTDNPECPIPHGSHSFFDTFAWLKCNGDLSSAKDELLRMGFLPAELNEPSEAAALPKQADFPIHAFPPLVGKYVDQVAYAMSVPKSMVITPLLGAMAGAIGNAYSIEVKSMFRQPSILWMMAISPPGTLKTPVVNAIEKLYQHAFWAAAAEYERAKHTAEANFHRSKKTYAFLMKNYEEEKEKINFNEPEIPLPPKKEKPKRMRKFVTSQGTLEGMLKQSESDTNGLTLLSSEFGTYTRSFGEYKKDKGGDISNWCRAYDGGRVTSTRADEYKEANIDRFTVSIAGMIQPHTCKEFVSRTDIRESGMWSRFLVCAPDHEFRPTCRDENIPMDSLEPMQEVFDCLIGIENDMIIDRPNVVIPASKEARHLFDDKIDEFRKMAFDCNNPDMSAYIEKRIGKVARISLVLHLLKAAIAKREIMSKGEQISIDTVKDALTIEQWYFDEAERVYPLLYSGFDGNEIQKRVFEMIDDAEGGITKRDIGQIYKKCRNELPAILRGLIDDGRITIKQQGKKTLYFSLGTNITPAVPVPSVNNEQTTPSMPVSAVQVPSDKAHDETPRTLDALNEWVKNNDTMTQNNDDGQCENDNLIAYDFDILRVSL